MAKEAPIEQVREVFDFWVETCKKGKRGMKPVLTDQRKGVIQRALRNYDVEYLKQSIIGVTKSDFHMGGNSRKKVYNDIELILRNAQKIEDFADMVEPEDEFLSDPTDRVNF